MRSLERREIDSRSRHELEIFNSISVPPREKSRRTFTSHKDNFFVVSFIHLLCSIKEDSRGKRLKNVYK